jgi:hypothetical protein
MAIVVRYAVTCSLVLIAVSATLLHHSRAREASAQAPCAILALDMGNTWDTESLDAIGGFTYTLVSPAAFASANLGAYDVLYAGSAFQDGPITVPSQASLDALNARTGDIATFVANGGGVVALAEPIGTGRFGWVPLAGTPGAHVDVEEIVVTAPFHPVNVGLTHAALSYWFKSSHHSFTAADAQYAVMSTTAIGGDRMTLAALHGDGRIVLSGQDPDYHWIEPDATSPPDPGAKTLLTNALNWACEPNPVGGAVVLPDADSLPAPAIADSGGSTLPTGGIIAAAIAAIAALTCGAILLKRRRT